MSLAMKGILVRSTPDVYVQKLLKEKHGDQIGLLLERRLSVRFKQHNSNSAQIIRVRAIQDENIISDRFLDSKVKRSRSSTRSAALLTPESPQTSQKPSMEKRVFTFGKGRSEGNKSMKSLLGGKGANLAEMASIGLSVPPGLTISTEACQEYQKNDKMLPEGLWEEIMDGLEKVEVDMGAFLGDPAKPLLLSVRSGAAISMPGMMDTVLNLGLNDEVVAGLAAKSGERFAYDSYRRFLDMFGDVVMGIPHSLFEVKLEGLKEAKGVELDTQLKASDLKELVAQYKKVYLEAKGEQFPSDRFISERG